MRISFSQELQSEVDRAYAELWPYTLPASCVVLDLGERTPLETEQEISAAKERLLLDFRAVMREYR